EGTSGRVYAAHAYCDAHLRCLNEAIEEGNKALQAGFSSAAVYNNLGYSYYTGYSTDRANRCRKAEALLRQALAFAPHMPAGYLTRAHRDLIQSESEPPRSLLQTAVVDVQKAVEIGPVNAELYYLAAKVLAKAASPRLHGRQRITLDSVLGGLGGRSGLD